MKLLQNRKSIISIIVIVILLIAIGGVIYSIYNSNRQETIAQPISENPQEIEENKNIAYINEIEENTRKYNYRKHS